MSIKLVAQIIKKDHILGDSIGQLARKLMTYSVKFRLSKIESDLKGPEILDVGLGTGAITNYLIKHNHKVTSIDVVDKSIYSNISPVLYDGENIPFSAKSFDTGLLISVLHHCTNPIRVLEETMRVCKRIIICEDTYRNRFEHILNSARDNISNFEFYQHLYHSTDEWNKIFKKRGWHSIKTQEWSNISFYGMYGRQTLFVIEPIKSKRDKN